MNAIRWGLTTMVVCAVALATTTLFGEDNTTREARDRAEIEALMWKYTRALDSGDGATYASTYTADGQFGAGGNPTKGRDALSKLVVQRPAAGAPARPPLYHMSISDTITVGWWVLTACTSSLPLATTASSSQSRSSNSWRRVAIRVLSSAMTTVNRSLGGSITNGPPLLVAAQKRVDINVWIQLTERTWRALSVVLRSGHP